MDNDVALKRTVRTAILALSAIKKYPGTPDWIKESVNGCLEDLKTYYLKK